MSTQKDKASAATSSRRPLTREEALEAKIDKLLREVGQGFVEVGYRARLYRAALRRSVFTGTAGEFYKAREFVWGEDDPRTIMPRATMRTGGQKIYCRINRPESQTTVHLFGDVNRTLDFGHSRESKLWLLARSAATVCLSLKSTQDLVRAALYANESLVWSMSKAQDPNRVIRQIIARIIEPVYSRGNLDSGMEQALRLLPGAGRNEVVILSDFLNLTAGQARLLEQVSRNNSIRAVVVQDKRERHLPEPPRWWPIPAPLRVFDLSTGKQVTWWLTSGNRARYTREFEEHEEKLRSFFNNNGIRYEFVSTDEGDLATSKVVGLLACPPLLS